MKITAFAIVMAFLSSLPCSAQEQAENAKSTIESFYRSYLDTHDEEARPHLPFSASFNSLLKKDDDVCKQKAGTDICGWGADGDIYLDTQESDPNLTYENSGIVVTELRPGQIEVNLNVYPSQKAAGDYYHRKFIFLMIREKGKWVVDDMISDGHSSRKQICDEINSYK